MSVCIFSFKRMFQWVCLVFLLFSAFGVEARVWRGLNAKDPLLSDGTVNWTVARRTAKVVIVRGRDGVTGVARWPNKKARFIVLTPQNDPHKYIIVTWSHPKKRAKKVKLFVPTYPRGKKPTTISDDETHTVVMTQQTSDSPADVHAFYARKLTAEGWKMVVPAIVSHGTIRGLATYQKKNRICFVQISKHRGRLNMITVLVKKGTL